MKNKKTILIVDDTPTNVSILFNALRNSDYRVLISTNGEDAIKKVEYANPDLILLDVMMPQMDGFEVCRILKSQKTTQHIPIIFMTALVDTLNKIKGFKLGAADYITKPFQYQEVLVRIHTHLTLKRQRENLEKKQRELEAMTHIIANDLKKPVNVMIDVFDMLMDELHFEVDPDTIRMLQNIKRAGKNITHTIDTLLLLSSTRSQSVTIEPIDMSAIIKKVQQRLLYFIEHSQAIIDMPNEWESVLGYAPWIEEVWCIYLLNALKYGGKPPYLELGMNCDGKSDIRFWIRDNGQGISAERQDTLFIPFSRISQIKRPEGQGLSLSIVQGIIEKLGGQVGVDSEVGKGSTFYFTLPTISS